MPSDKERYAEMNRALIAAGRTNRIQGRLDGIDTAAMNRQISEIRRRNRFTVALPVAQATEPDAPISMSDALRAMRQNDEAG